MLSREQLLGMTERRYKDLDDIIGGVRIRSLSEAEKSDYEVSVLTNDGKFAAAKIRRQKRRLIVMCLVDENNNRLLRDSDEKQLEAVDGAITSRLYEACREHCGFEPGEIEELVKNSSEMPADVSPSD